MAEGSLNLFSLLFLGFFLGMRHATDADHVVAIATIVSRERSLRSSALIGAAWGMGHTIMVMAVGIAIIAGGVIIPPRLGLSMEFAVGIMLILLGVFMLTGMGGVFGAARDPQRHDHVHIHGDYVHRHPHGHGPVGEGCVALHQQAQHELDPQDPHQDRDQPHGAGKEITTGGVGRIGVDHRRWQFRDSLMRIGLFGHCHPHETIGLLFNATRGCRVTMAAGAVRLVVGKSRLYACPVK